MELVLLTFIYVREDIPSRELRIHDIREGIGSIFFKTNLIKTKWLFVAAITHLASLTNTSLKILEKR